MNTSNINHLWTSLLVEELVRNNIRYFCISPGSRSTPLTVAAAENVQAETTIHFDERGAAFHAIGYARATEKPAVLICTSGTAVANCLPAVIEADRSCLPLIILSADRPPELKDVGANQTIDQAHIFDRYTRWQIELPCPDPAIDPTVVLTTVDEVVFKAGLFSRGPVHINCMFREPLAPLEDGIDYSPYLEALGDWPESGVPYKQAGNTKSQSSDFLGEAFLEGLNRTEHGIIVVGRLRKGAHRRGIMELMNKIKWPTFPDVSSGLRIQADHDCLIPYYDQLLQSKRFKGEHRPEVCLHIGGPVVSKRLLNYIEAADPENYIVIDDSPHRYDPLHRVTHRFQCDPGGAGTVLGMMLGSPGDQDWLVRFRTASEAARTGIEEHVLFEDNLSEPALARLLSELAPEDSGLFLASSLPVREMDMFGSHSGAVVHVASNRGASGIDGTIASASGFAVGLRQPVTLLTGDLAFLHDLNSLALVKKLPIPLVIVIVNNDGGNIFSFLPIAEAGEAFEEFFLTPHGLAFEDAARMFGLPYASVDSADGFRDVYIKAIASGQSQIIEVTIQRQNTVEAHRKIAESIRSKLGD